MADVPEQRRRRSTATGFASGLRPVSNASAKFDLAFSLGERAPRRTPAGIRGILDMRPTCSTVDHRDSGAAAGAAVGGSVAEPNRTIGRLDILTTDEPTPSCTIWNDTARAIAPATLPEDVRAQRRARQTRRGSDSSTTAKLRGLDGPANQLAHHLPPRSRARDVVGLCVERSPDMLVGSSPSSRAGGAYLPLDPTYPSERLASCWPTPRRPCSSRTPIRRPPRPD